MFKPLAFAALFLFVWLIGLWLAPPTWKPIVLPAFARITYVMRLMSSLPTGTEALAIFWLSVLFLNVYEILLGRPDRISETALLGLGHLLWLLLAHMVLETESRSSASPGVPRKAPGETPRCPQMGC